MISASLPANEVERLETLRAYHILDTLPEKEYDDIVKLASEICDVPISLISLVDEDRCWFKARVGLSQEEAPRKIAYAAHAVLQPDEPTIIEDALQDERFFDCPLVLNNPPMRFYVGTPLVTKDRHVLGTLCVIDTKPRRLSQQQIRTLKILAASVVNHFELKKKLAEVEELNNRLSEAYTDLESFSYSVSHDLKAPLRSVNSFIEIIQEDFGEELSEDVSKYLNYIKVSGQRMNILINDLLKLSKVSRSPVSRESVRITAMSEEILKEIPLSADYTIELSTDLEATGDRGLVKAILTNLIENAVKYSAQETSPAVQIGRTRYGQQDCFFVKDNGVGFDGTYAGDIFRPFSRMHTDKEFEGTGIGLAIVKKAVDRHGGMLAFESKEGEGSTFYFNLG